MRYAIGVVPGLVMLSLLGEGCAKYEYNLVKPAELSRHIGGSVDAVVPVDPLEYRMRSVENRLVVRIFNPTSDPIELIGSRSTVVDPDGQSHPVRGQTIAPAAFIKLILPPERPRVYDPYYGPYYGPSIGVGVGAYHRVDAWPYPHCYQGWPYRHWFPAYDGYAYAGPGAFGPWLYEPYYLEEPRYLAVVDPNDNYYWEWKGEGEIRLSLVYRRGDKEFTHDVLFRRQKM